MRHWYCEFIYKKFLNLPNKYHFWVTKNYIKNHPENHSLLIAMIKKEKG